VVQRLTLPDHTPEPQIVADSTTQMGREEQSVIQADRDYQDLEQILILFLKNSFSRLFGRPVTTLTKLPAGQQPLNVRFYSTAHFTP